MKTCSKCGHSFLRSTENFYRKPSSTDGLSGRCKPCERAQVRAYKATERGKQKTREWRAKPESRDVIRKIARRRWHRPDVQVEDRARRRLPEVRKKRAAYDREYYAANVEKILKRKREYRARMFRY